MAEEKKSTLRVEETQIPAASEQTRTHETELTPEQHGKLRSKRSLPLTVFLLSVDVILALSPLLFLGIAFAAIAYNGRPVADDGHTELWFTTDRSYNVTGGAGVIQAARVGVSIFPLVFAAIVGRFMKAFAIHRAEQGESLGNLEQLYGSTSVASAVQTTFALKGTGLLGTGIVLLWLLSPLGGQGVQRVLHTKINYNHTTGDLYYANTSGSSFAYKDHFAMAMRTSGISAIMSTALMSTQLTLGTGRDIWGNVRIPYFEPLQDHGSGYAAVDDSGSLMVFPGSDAVSSSMLGLLVHNIPANTSAEFSTISSYINMTCETPKTFVYSVSNDADGNIIGNLTGYTDFLKWLPSLMLTNMSTINTADNNTGWTSWNKIIDVVVGPTDNLTGYANATSPPTFIYASQWDVAGVDNRPIYAYKCTAKTTWVNSSVSCDESGACNVWQQTKIQDPSPGTINPLFDPTQYTAHGSALQHFVGTLQSYGEGSATGIANPIDFYLSGAPYVYLLDDKGSRPDYSKVSGQDFATRLGSLVNSFWLAGLEYSSIAEPKLINQTLLKAADPHDSTYSYPPTIGYDLVTVSATFRQGTEVYEVSWPFTAIAILLCGALLFLGFLGIYYRQTNTYPDVLGFVSSLTRDNPHFVPPPRSEKLDGLEMARYFKDTKVKLVNVVDQDEAHRVTLRRADHV